MRPIKTVLNTWKSWDQDIQRLYTKLGSKLSKEKSSGLADGLGFFGGQFWAFLPIPPIVNAHEGRLLRSAITVIPILFNLVESMSNTIGFSNREQATDGETVSLNKLRRTHNYIIENSRMPIFLTGLSLIGKSAYDLTTNNKPIDPWTIIDTIEGLDLLICSSSMYLKDQDPTLLKKEPSWFSRELSYLVGSVKNLHKKPQPGYDML
jgi:hypothetical protein